MKKLRVLRRPDGIIELRRRRLRDSVIMHDAAVLLALCLGCIAFIAVLAAMIVETPGVLAATGALALPVVPSILLARSVGLAPVTARQPGPRPPDAAA